MVVPLLSWEFNMLSVKIESQLKALISSYAPYQEVLISAKDDHI